MVLADCTTAMPDLTLKIAKAIQAKGGRFVDTADDPHAQGGGGRQAGLMTGGDPATLAEIRPVLECFSDLIVHCGDVGAGHKVKLVNNMLSLGYGMVTAEALLAAKKGGIDLKALRDVVSGGGANSIMFQRLCRLRDRERQHRSCAFAIANAAKRRALLVARARAWGQRRRLRRRCTRPMRWPTIHGLRRPIRAERW